MLPKITINNSAERFFCHADLIFTIIILKLKGKIPNTHLFGNDLHMYLDLTNICLILTMSMTEEEMNVQKFSSLK